MVLIRVILKLIIVPYPYYTLYCVLIKDARGNSFFSDTEDFFNNAGTAHPLVFTVTTIKPMVAAELHSLWLQSPPKPTKARQNGYIMREFTKAPQISSPSSTTTRYSLFETQSLRH